MGRWSSDVYRVYTRVCASEVLAISARMHTAHGEPTLEEHFAGYTQSRSRRAAERLLAHTLARPRVQVCFS